MDTDTTWEDPKKVASTPGESSWDVPKSHMRKIRGCRGGSPYSSKLGLTSQKFYDLISKIVPEEILSRSDLSGWNKGRPGKKSRLIVAMIQMKVFNGDLTKVDGCLGTGTLEAINKK